MKFRCFCEKFYSDKRDIWPEMLSKQTRPYFMAEINFNNFVKCYIPLRSNVTHEHIFVTKEPAGLDYSKSIFLTEGDILLYVERRVLRINNEEFKIISNSERLIKEGMINYINKYKDAKEHIRISANEILVRFSTLKYFERFIDSDT